MSSSSSAGRQPEQGLKCPRCDSPNTKFCYYNNYSLSQPRHFCKTCRRYWTRGGVLRNVPVGGGCRKNKKSKSPASSRIAFNPIETFAAPPPPAAAMASTCAFGFNGNTHSSIASSIESLSSVNQELHWKLQQQRLQAVYFGGEGQNESCVSTSSLTTQQTGPLSFVATDHTIPAAAAWFPETTSYFLLPNTTSTSAAATTTNNNINNNSSSSSNNNNNNSGNWNGIPGWIDMPQFTTLLP